jgi:hypothetical protein
MAEITRDLGFEDRDKMVGRALIGCWLMPDSETTKGEPESPWRISDRFDPGALPLANRHYNRQKPESPQFVPPGRNLVLRADDYSAVWTTVWPDFAGHDWKGAWVNTLFRNEGDHLSSDLIRFAVAHSCAKWEPPELGIVSFVDPSKIKSKRDPGYCYLMAGWTLVGKTRGGASHMAAASRCDA